MFNFLKKLFGKADLNKDGRVDRADARVAVDAVSATAKAGATKAKTRAKSATAKVKKAVTK